MIYSQNVKLKIKNAIIKCFWILSIVEFDQNVRKIIKFINIIEVGSQICRNIYFRKYFHI